MYLLLQTVVYATDLCTSDRGVTSFCALSNSYVPWLSKIVTYVRYFDDTKKGMGEGEGNHVEIFVFHLSKTTGLKIFAFMDQGD